MEVLDRAPARISSPFTGPPDRFPPSAAGAAGEGLILCGALKVPYVLFGTIEARQTHR